MTPTYAAFFLGQFGPAFSWGIPGLAAGARKLGYKADVFNYTQIAQATTNIDTYRELGFKIALIGYSLGVSTATEIQTTRDVDLLCCIAASTLAINYPVDHAHTKRAVLWAGTDFLSSAGQHDGYDLVNHVSTGFGVPIWSHLLMSVSSVVSTGVLAELARLRGASQ